MTLANAEDERISADETGNHETVDSFSMTIISDPLAEIGDPDTAIVVFICDAI